jgi:hypothetical protein
MATTINASTSAGLVSTADTSGVLQLQAQGTTVLNGELGKALALQGATSTTGCGIAFPATQVASSDVNTLDDYEEGSWTPVLQGVTTAGTTTYNLRNGKYTKIGNLVVCDIYLGVTAATGTGTLQIVGLPFSRANSNSVASGAAWFNGLTCTGKVPIIQGNGTGVDMYVSLTSQSGGSLSNAVMTDANFAAGFQIYASFSYFTS